MIPGVSGSDKARARGRNLRSRAGDIEANASSRLQLRLSDAEQLGRELCVGLTSTEIGIRAHRSYVRRGCGGGRLFGSRFGVSAGRARRSLRRFHAPDRAEVEQILLHAATNIESVDGTLDLSPGVEYRLLSGWRGEVDSQSRSVECPTRLLHVAAHRRQQVGSTLANARLGLVGPQSCALCHGAVLGRESCCITEREWKHGRILCAKARRDECDHCGRAEKKSA